MPPSSWSQTKPQKLQQAELLGVAAGFMLVAWETRHIPDDNILHGERRDKLRSSPVHLLVKLLGNQQAFSWSTNALPHVCLSLVPTLNQMNAVYTRISHFFKIHFIVTLPLCLDLPDGFLLSGLSAQVLYVFLIYSKYAASHLSYLS
jgi:hypothetical protein